jgi:peptidylprolyl isomerase
MTEAKQGDTVKVHYKGTLTDGTVFDSTYEQEPLEFTIGEGKIIPGFEESVVGMEEGQTKDVSVAPEQAYGDYNENGVVNFPRENLPEDINPELGMTLQMTTPEEQTVYVTVTEIEDETITLDANHPLAGKDLHFQIELLEVNQSA